MFGIFAIVLFFGYSLFILSTEYDRVSKSMSSPPSKQHRMRSMGSFTHHFFSVQ
jgi:hypothetical protein